MGKHDTRPGDRYVKHDGVPAPGWLDTLHRTAWSGTSWKQRLGALALTLATFAIIGLLVAAPDMPYWGQPNVHATVTAENTNAPDISEGKSSCDASYFQVVAEENGRQGQFHDCVDYAEVGDQVIIRWHPDHPDTARQDVMSLGEHVILTGCIAAVVLALTPVIMWNERRKQAKKTGPSRLPQYRVRRQD